MDLTREQIKIYIQQINDKVKIKDILENFSVSVQGLAQDIYDEQYSELQQYLEKIKQEQAK